MVTPTKPAENSPVEDARARLDKALARVEAAFLALQKQNETLTHANHRASEELGLHIRNLGNILERQE